MEQMTWIDDDILKQPIWNDTSSIERVIIIGLIPEFVAQDDILDKAWNELETQQQVLLLSRGIIGD